MTIQYRTRLIGAHVHVQVFIGSQVGALGLAGELCMRPEEWKALKENTFEHVLIEDRAYVQQVERDARERSGL